MKVLGERVEDIRVKDEAEEDLVEVEDKLFSTITGCQDTTHMNVLSRHTCRVDIVLNLIT